MGQKHRFLKRGLVALLAATMIIVPSEAGSNDAGMNLANFSESRGCDPHLRGTARPFVDASGPMSSTTEIRGPWGDMYGRDYAQVRGSIVDWRLPGSSRTVRVHERALPALEQAGAALRAHLAQGKRYYVYSAGSWVWRTVGGSVQPSEHALGTAIDFNPSDNPYSRDNLLRTNMPDWFVQAFVDAGFCWGGHWVDVKDAMHFSWSGPTVMEGYERRPPYPPLVGSTGYSGVMLTHTTVLNVPDGASFAIADVTGEGAPDLVSAAPSGRLEAVGAVGDYGTIALRESVGPSSGEVVIGDYDLDGRPDAWVLERSGSTIRVKVRTWSSGYRDAIAVPTTVPATSGEVLLGHYDSDFKPDLYVVDGPVVRVYSSTSGYMTAVASLPLPSGTAGTWHLMTGDRDFDGKSDVYAVSRGASPQVRISTAAGTEVVLNPQLAISTEAEIGLGDYDGDGWDDLFVLDGSVVTIALGGWSHGAPDRWFQREASLPPDAGPECVGGSCDTVGYVDEVGEWTIADRPRTGPATSDFYYGNPNDVPFMGDWNCDGVDTPGLYRRSDGFVYLRNANTQGIADREFYFGNPSDVPLVGDFDGDGCDTVSVFRPSEQRMYIVNALAEDQAGLGAADYFFGFGDTGDTPFVGDFDGDGIDEIGVHRSSDAYVYLKYELESGVADTQFHFGEAGDVALAGDWNGDGVDTLAVYRPDDGNWYIRLSNTPGTAHHAFHFHAHGEEILPVHGNTGG